MNGVGTMAIDRGRPAVVQMDERRLIDRVRQGEPKAFAELVARYRTRVYGYLTRCGLDASTRDDVFQEVFLKVHRALESFHSERSFRPWLFTIVANTVRSHYRKHRVRELVYETDTAATDTTASASQIFEAHETAEWLATAITQLPFSQREVIALVCVEQMAQADAAVVLDVPLNTVKTNLRRARLTLAKHLASRNARMREASQ